MKAEVVIAGGGLAGAAAAILLARDGRDVLLLERELQTQHKVCGEFLSREALRYLQSLGIDAVELGAVPIHAVRLAGQRWRGETRLPFAAMSLTRKRIDAALLRMAEAAGARVMRGCSVQGIERVAKGWSVTVSAAGVDKMVSAESMFLATGKHDLRGRPRPRGTQSDLVAFKMYWRLAPKQAAALEGHVELMLYRGGYGGLQPVEEGAANLCCLIRRAELQRMGGRWENLLDAMQRECGLLRERMEGATPMLDKPLAISSIPYGYVRSASDGLWALGDQAAVIPSFTGDGMSIALHSGCAAARMYMRGDTPEIFQEQMEKQLSRQVELATMVSRGLVWPPSSRVCAAAVAFWPGLLGLVARSTRIPEAAMRGFTNRDSAESAMRQKTLA